MEPRVKIFGSIREHKELEAFLAGRLRIPVADLATARRHPHPGRRREDGTDARATRSQRSARPSRDRRRALPPPALRECWPRTASVIAADLLDGALERLPRVRNVIFMAGRKFGAVGNRPLTWAVNAYLPGDAEAFRMPGSWHSRPAACTRSST